MNRTFKDRFFDRICALSRVLKFGFSLVVVLLGLNLVALPFLETDSPSYPVLWMNVVIFSSLLVSITAIIWYCHRRVDAAGDRQPQ